jgi:hypothetical protein
LHANLFEKHLFDDKAAEKNDGYAYWRNRHA